MAAACLATMAISRAVAEQWVSIYDGTNHKDDLARRVAVSDELGESVIVTGESDGFANGVGTWMDITTYGIDPGTGDPAWSAIGSPADNARRYDPINDFGVPGPPNSVECGVDVLMVTGKGDAYVAGRAYNPVTGKYDFVTIRYGKGTGNLIWQVRNQTGDAPRCLGALPDILDALNGPCADISRIYVGGWHAQAGLPALTTLKYGQTPCP